MIFFITVEKAALNMIKDIEISNFRCFEHTKIAGFERVNLIGGQKQLALLVFVCYFLL
jgi:hypothetical protein